MKTWIHRHLTSAKIRTTEKHENIITTHHIPQNWLIVRSMLCAEHLNEHHCYLTYCLIHVHLRKCRRAWCHAVYSRHHPDQRTFTCTPLQIANQWTAIPSILINNATFKIVLHVGSAVICLGMTNYVMFPFPCSYAGNDGNWFVPFTYWSARIELSKIFKNYYLRFNLRACIHVCT